MGKLIFKGVERNKSAIGFYERSKIEINNTVLIDMCCYDLQQAMEFILKGLLELNGIEYNKTHDVRAHIQQLYSLRDKELDDILNEISLRASTFNEWQTKSRYMDSFYALETDIEKAIEICSRLITHIETQYLKNG